MRFESLELTAFGPFSGEKLNLSGGAPGGLHVVFGPNEAGKSTSLRAVRGLLYGIDLRSRDAHLHPLPKLEVGAEISHDGVHYSLRRLKRRKDTLVDREGNPVSEALLQQLLGYIDERTFASRLGLDQVELEKGAEALLGGSEQGLFAAGTAGADVRRVLAQLEKECAELFLQKGKNPRLNQALGRFSEAQRFALEKVSPPEKWLEQKRALDQSEARAQLLKAQRRELKEELGRKARLLSLLSELSRLVEVEKRLDELGDGVLLDEDASARRLTAEREKRDADIELGQGEKELSELEAALIALGPRASWADVDDEGLKLGERLGAGQKARADLPKRKAELDLSLGTLVQLGRPLGINLEPATVMGRLEALLPTPSVVRRANLLIAREGKLRAELERARDKLVDLEQELARDAGQDDASQLDLERLARALVDGREARSEVARYRDWGEQLDRERKRVSWLERELLLAAEFVQPTRVQPLDRSLIARAERAEAQAERLSSEQVQLERAQDDLESEDSELALRLGQLERGEELPSLGKLGQVRARRDEALLALSSAQEPPQRALEELVTWIVEADRLADRLREDSSRVAQAEELVRERQRLAVKREAHARRLEKVEAEQIALGQAWTREFSTLGIVAAAGDWVRSARALVELEEARQRCNGLEEQREVLGARLREVRIELGGALGQAPADQEVTLGLGGWVEQAEARLGQLRRRDEQRRAFEARRLERQSARGSAELAERNAANALSTWEQEWRALLDSLGQPETTTTEALAEVLLGFAELSRVLGEARSLGGRIAGIERDSRSFTSDLARIAERHAPDLVGRDHLEVAEELKGRLARSRIVEQERLRLTEEIRRRRDRSAEAQRKQASAGAELEALVRAAGAVSLEVLPELETQSRLRRELGSTRAELRRVLLDKSGGEGIESLLGEARAVEHKKLFASVEDLDERLEEVEAELRQAEADAAANALGLDRFGSEVAADARQAVVTRGAEARELLRHYLVQKTAQTLLEREMSSYAERYAGPLAKRAAELLDTLTLGAYRSLRVSSFDKTIGVVSTKTGQEVEIEHLSRGTRAQLYFALRVASLEAHFDERPPVPLLLDDLFVDFDDDRTSAAFEILGKLAQKVQILYFSHLARDVALAHDAVPRGLCFEHTLGGG